MSEWGYGLTVAYLSNDEGEEVDIRKHIWGSVRVDRGTSPLYFYFLLPSPNLLSGVRDIRYGPGCATGADPGSATLNLWSSTVEYRAKFRSILLPVER